MGIIIARKNNNLIINSKYEIPDFSTTTINLSDVLQPQDLCTQTKQELTKIFQLLQLQYNTNKEIDKYEFCIIMILFKKNSLEHKIEAIYNLITDTGVLSFQEFFWITQSFLRGTCKINIIQIPSFDQVLKLTQRMYQQMRKDLDEKIMLIELIDYIKSNSDVSQFLLKYYRIQSYENAFRQQEKRLNEYIEMFNKSVGLSKQYVNLDQLIQNWNQDTQDQQYLIQLISKQQKNQKQDRNFIKFSQYLHVISNYLAYKVNDIDNGNNLSLNFINYLIYAQEEIIISNDRYEQIKQQLCKDRQIISLQMWMDYQCIQENNKFESQLRTFIRYYEIIYNNNSFNQLITKIKKRINNFEMQNILQKVQISKALKEWIQNPELYNVGSIELKLKIEQLLRQ